MRAIFFSLLLILGINVNAQSLTPVLSESKTWVLCYRNIDIAEPLYYKLSIDEAYIMDDTSMWILYETRCDVDGKNLVQAVELFDGYLIGEQEGKLFFCKEDCQSEQIVFMDFSMGSGDVIDFDCPVDGEPIHLEVTAVSDTIVAGNKAPSSRRCLYVSYNNGTSDVWVEGVGSLKYGVAFPLLFYAVGGRPSLMTCNDGDVCIYSSETSGNQSQTAIDGHVAWQSVNSVCYDLQGRRVGEVRKGVYIQNGRKVVVK